MNYKRFVTNYEKGQFWQEENKFVDGVDCMKVVNLYPELTYQLVRGFGGAFTEASGYNLTLLSEEKMQEVMDAYFGEQGLQYSLGRTHINSCDFALGNYAYVEDAEDADFKSFSMERDKKYLFPMIRKAQEIRGKKLNILASPWSPPAFMKTNGEMNHGGELKEEYYEVWARYLAKYIVECKKEGIEISMLTIQNEPQAVQSWDSCIYSAEQEKVFVRDHLGPVLEKEGLSDIKILIWDHNKEIMYERTKDILLDSEAAKYINGVAFHWYSGDHFEAVGLVRERFPEKELFFTEGCVEYSRFADSNDVTKAEMYAHDIIGNFNAGMNGYIDWNLLLDEKGGPNHVNNFCAAPIMCNPSENTVEKRMSYYYIGQFSRYVKQGAKRVAVTKYTAALDTVGFVNPDGERVLVLLNRSDSDIPVSVREYEEGKTFIVEAHSIVTICYC